MTQEARPYKTKLIEKALPLQAINEACAREKNIRHGHPSTLHLWWARRPLAACRAVIWSSLVDDPSAHTDRFPTEEAQEIERQRLFKILEQLVVWENSTNEDVLSAARAEIDRSTDGNPPPILDPFAGGGSIPLEAHRLGLEAHASDLNPIPVLLNKAMIEIPPRFGGQVPVNPDDRERGAASHSWKAATGLAADVAYYGRWMREQALARIGHHYPTVELDDGSTVNVITWIWARTVPCPNPACGIEAPLLGSTWLSKKKGKEAFLEVDVKSGIVSFDVRRHGTPSRPDGTVSRKGAVCVACNSAIPFAHIRSAGKRGELRTTMSAIVADSPMGRSFLAPTPEAVSAATVRVDDAPSGEISHWPGRTNVVEYGMTEFADLFSARQLRSLVTFSDLVGEAREIVLEHARGAGMESGPRLHEGGTGYEAYADAVATYLALAVGRFADINNSLCRWEVSKTQVRNLFSRQAIPMIWDFAENNIFNGAAGDFGTSLANLVKAIPSLDHVKMGHVRQQDAQTSVNGAPGVVVSTDPPYYDNIGYADLSDFFYVWIRRSLGDRLGEDGTVAASSIWPEHLRTMLVPKTEELIAKPYRHGGVAEAKEHFESGMSTVFSHIHDASDSRFPTTVFYAFKQSEADDSGTASTGWETMLEALKQTGFEITATWPMRTEMANKILGVGSNILASSVVLVCRPVPVDAPEITRREFIRQLRQELPVELAILHQGEIAPVDVPQSAIGPGMRVFTRCKAVLGDDGEPISVREALRIINQILAEVVAETEGDFDNDTRWAIQWFKQNQFTPSSSGDADNIARATNTSIQGLIDSGIVEAGGGKTRLYRPEELSPSWDPARDKRVPVWEVTHQLIRVLNADGEDGAARLLAKVGAVGEQARDLAYAMYATCDQLNLASEAGDYNQLVSSWARIRERANDLAGEGEQGGLF